MNFDQFSLQFDDGNINVMSVVVPQEEHVPMESSRTHHSGHNTERISEDSLPEALVDEVENLHQQKVFADLFANDDREENDSIQTFIADIDQKSPDCHSLGYVDPVLEDPQNTSLEAGLFQVSNKIRRLEMYHDRLTGDTTNSKQIISSGDRMSSDVQGNLVGPSEQPMILEVHKQLDNSTVVQQQLDRQKSLTEDEEALIKQVAQTSAMKEALSTLMGTENIDPVARGQSKAFPCPECGKKFSWKSSLGVHSRTHTDVRPFGCEQCGAAFRRKCILALHQRTHSGERPFACQNCNASFARKSCLTRHSRAHANKKSRTCIICNQAFRYKKNWSEHMLIHSGEMPHKCTVCGKAFRRRSGLNKHRKIHARDQE